MSRRALQSFVLALFLIASACSSASPSEPELAARGAALISRHDDRSAPDAALDPAFASYARASVAALVATSRVQTDGAGVPMLSAVPLYANHELTYDVELCRDERFALEPTPVSCSATLIAHDLVLTAGHCVTSASQCAATAVVFGFEADVAGEVQPLTAGDVYACQAIVARNSGGAQPDFAVLRLDRSVLGRQPARVARDARALPLGTPLLGAGHPLGLPLKIANGGVTTVLPTGYSQQEPRFLASNLDSFTDSSGSGAFLAQPLTGYALTGIVSGTPFAADFTYDATRNCNRYERRSLTTLWLTYAHQAISALCAAVDPASYPDLCGCGDATCEPAADEDGTVCAADCADLCGDGACLGDEEPSTCSADCGSCGDGLCDADETCCADCGCAAGFVCDQALCAPDLATAGADCSQPIAIEATGTQTLHTPTGAAACYTFALSETRRVRWQGNASTHAPVCTAVPCGGTSTFGPSLTLAAGTYYLPLPGDTTRPRSYVVMFDDGDAQDGLTCDAAVPITPASDVMLSGSTAGRFRSPLCAVDSTYSCAGPDNHYTFTLDAPTLVSATATGFQHIALVLHSGLCTGGAAVEIDIDRAGTGAASLHRILAPGVYRLLLDGEQSWDEGAYDLALSFTTPPLADGDDCSEPIELVPSGAYSVAGDTTDAANDHVYASEHECTVTAYGNDRYYAFTLSEPTRIDASTDAAHASALFLEEGECALGLGLRCERGITGLSRVLDPGRYVLVVDGNEHHDAGPYTLNLEFTTSPPALGESCEDAIEIPATGQQRVIGNVYGAANDLDSRCMSQTRGDHAYTFTLTEPRAVHFETQGSNRLYVALGTDCASNISAMCVSMGYSENRALAAGTYFLIVDADRYATDGAYDIAIDFESVPRGTTCFDTLPLAIAETPTTVSAPPAIGLGTSAGLIYGFTLATPSRLQLATAAPAYLRISALGSYVQQNSGELDANVPAGTYCVVIIGDAAAPELELTASATALSAPDGRGCSDAIPVAAPGSYDFVGVTTFGANNSSCESSAAQVYGFELTERTRVRAVVSDGFVISVYDDSACADLHYCTSGTGGAGIEDTFDPGQYTLAVSGDSLIPYTLSLDLDCDTDDDGVCDASDACYVDPNKVEPGVCGCAIPDTDRDGDGFANCVDACPREAGMGTACPLPEPDASVPDASVPDASVPDASVPDEPDSSVPDMPDATVDAFVPDVDLEEDSSVDEELEPDASADAGHTPDGSTASDAQVTEPPRADSGDPVLNDPLDASTLPPDSDPMSAPPSADASAELMDSGADSSGCACTMVRASSAPSRASRLGLVLLAFAVALRMRRRLHLRV